jgi:hypothetical protein
MVLLMYYPNILLKVLKKIKIHIYLVMLYHSRYEPKTFRIKYGAFYTWRLKHHISQRRRLNIYHTIARYITKKISIYIMCEHGIVLVVVIWNLFVSKKGSSPPDSTRVHVWESQNWCFLITKQLNVYHLPRTTRRDILRCDRGTGFSETETWERPWCYGDMQVRTGDVQGHKTGARLREVELKSSQIMHKRSPCL